MLHFSRGNERIKGWIDLVRRNAALRRRCCNERHRRGEPAARQRVGPLGCERRRLSRRARLYHGVVGPARRDRRPQDEDRRRRAAAARRRLPPRLLRRPGRAARRRVRAAARRVGAVRRAAAVPRGAGDGALRLRALGRRRLLRDPAERDVGPLLRAHGPRGPGRRLARGRVAQGRRPAARRRGPRPGPAAGWVAAPRLRRRREERAPRRTIWCVPASSCRDDFREIFDRDNEGKNRHIW